MGLLLFILFIVGLFVAPALTIGVTMIVGCLWLTLKFFKAIPLWLWIVIVVVGIILLSRQTPS